MIFTRLALTTARHLTADVARVQRSGRVPSVAAGVVRSGGLAWSTGRGFVDGEAPDEDRQYRIGSITKTVTAVAVLRLRDEGLLGLDDPLEQYLPGTPFGDRTIAQLLAHVAGLRAEAPGQWWERTPGRSWDELAAQFTAATEVPYGPGRRFHYANLGYGALGQVVSRLRDRPWADVVRDEVLLPLEMTRTTTRSTGRAATGWAVHPWADVLQPEPQHDFGGLAAAGQLWSTVADLGRFAQFLLGDTGSVLDPQSLAEMRQPAGVDDSLPIWSAYGLGLQVVRRDGQTYVGHSGSVPGFQAGLWVDLEQQTAAIALGNATSGLDGQLPLRLLAVVREREPYVVADWEPLDYLDEDDLGLIGSWYWGTSIYGVRLSSGGLLELLPAPGGGRGSRFARRDDGGWTGLDGYHAGEPLDAVLDDNGQVVALDLGSFLFTRTPYDPAAPVPGGAPAGGWGE